MEVLFGDQQGYMNQALLERVNPVYKTARTTLFGLAGANDEDAKALVEELHISQQESLSSERANATDENALLNEIVIETRFRTINRLALQSGASLVVDLPCGFTPRGIQFAREDRQYLGLDLPASIAEGESIIMSKVDEDKKHLVRYAGCDATNYESLKKALAGYEGDVCICTEGLLMYFTQSEVGELCDNVRAVLKDHGGCWLIADPEVSIQYGLTLKTIFPDIMERLLSDGQKNVEDKAEIRMSRSDLIVNPVGDIADNMKKAMAFLASHGLKAERLMIGDYMGDLKSLDKLGEEKAELYRQAMKRPAFWRITLADQMPEEEKKAEDKDFAVRMKREGFDLKVKLSGRVDTLTAPMILSLFEEEKKKEIDRVQVDCRELDYISSAGLRVLLIMHKSAKEGIALHGINDLVREILEQTGFYDIFGLD